MLEGVKWAKKLIMNGYAHKIRESILTTPAKKYP
jgi:hypothetical protein